jgi:hypothetical protein
MYKELTIVVFVVKSWKVLNLYILDLDMASIESLVALRIGEECEFKKSTFCLCILKCVLEVESFV